MTTRTLTVSRSVMDATLPFALPIGLSAFLLFTVEPLVGRLVLPVFGGTPAVWATVLFFFQTVLLLGYLYGHLSVTLLGRWGPLLHVGLVAVGFVMLLSAPTRVDALRNEATPPVVDLIGILIALVGLPAFVLTTTTPLLSGWFHGVRDEERQGDPYWLYALSNAGSLLALLAYPLLIEPRLGLGTQRMVWTATFAGLGVLIGWAAYRALPDIIARPRGYALAPEQRLIGASSVTGQDVEGGTVDWARRGRWLLLAAIPSGLLSAVTNFVTTDLVSAPLIWVLPLALYLVSFIVAFSPRSRRVIAFAVAAAPAMVTILWVPYGSAGAWPILVLLASELLAFLIVAVALHGRLAQDRPGPGRLTEFYLVISTGGALASAFVAILAPTVFPDIWEYPILLVGALAALALVTGLPTLPSARRSGFDFRPFLAGFAGRMAPYVVVAAVLAAILILTGSQATQAGIRWLVVGGLVLAFGGRAWFLAAATAFVLVLASLILKPAAEFRDRSFFGVTEVLRPSNGAVAYLMNGTTLHGAQMTDPTLRRTPVTYYSRSGPVGDIFEIGAPSSFSDPQRIAIVGLGAGGLAAYHDEWMTMTFFEIDPVVIQVASDPRYFTYLADAPGRPRIVEGDARLTLAEEPDASYDLLIIDAFSSDTVPLHLVTMEGIAEELRTVVPDGVIAFNISNRYYELKPAIAAALAELDMGAMYLGGNGGTGPNGEPFSPSRWMVGSRSPTVINAFRGRGWEDVIPADRPFTDDYADLLSYLKLNP